LIALADVPATLNTSPFHDFPQLSQFADIALFLLRLMVGIIFLTSGWKHVREPEARSRDIGMSKVFTIFLGAAELAGGLGLISGLLIQLAAIGLILMMLGAIQKKIFVWHTGLAAAREQMAGATIR
jgi:putative oxidoreductase